MTAYILTIALGLLVGLSLGTLGGGGSTLAVPILVFVAGIEAQDATSASLLVVGVAACLGASGHYQKGNLRLGAGLAFGAAGIFGSGIGTTLNQSLPEQMLLLAFSALIVFVAIRMHRSVRPLNATTASTGSSAPGFDDLQSSSGGTALMTSEPLTGLDFTLPSIAKLAAAATGVGALTGLFGVGGGFAVVPALTLLLGFRAKEAIGTSLIVIAINAAVALSMRFDSLNFDWALVLPFLVTVAIGVVGGTRLADRIEADRLTRGFALMLGAVAIYTAVSSLAG